MKWICCLISVAFFLVLSCGGGVSTPPVPSKGKAPIAKTTEREPAQTPVKKAPERVETEYSYNPAGKPDPFKPFIQLNPVRELARMAPLTPLQKYELSQLKLVAIISAPEGNTALVEDSAGKGFFLKKGTLIGKNDGRVVNILKEKVIVEEEYQDVLGRAKSSEISLSLYRPEEEGGQP